MTETVSVEEAEARFWELLERVEAGEEFVIARDGVPVVVFGPPRGEEVPAPAS